MRLRRFLLLVAILAAFAGGSPPLSALDRVRVESNIDAAIMKYGVSGNGVLIAILDRGIDWLNNDFRYLDGTTRIAGIFDLTDDSGAGDPGNPYGMGTLYTRAQINAALTGGPALAHRDAVGHGTTTTGIAAGSGRNSIAGKYRGVAPNAEVLVAKVTSDGAPAHDGQPAEAPYYNPARLPVAIDWVKARAAAAGKPVVMLLNLGSQGGPTDGTSTLARKVDTATGPGIPGVVFVSGPGDDGGIDNRAGGTVTQGGAQSIQIQKGAAGTLIFDLWYQDTDRFTVSFNTPSGSFGPYAGPALNTGAVDLNIGPLTFYHRGSAQDFYGATSPTRELYIQITGPVGVYTVTLTGTTVVGAGRFDATLNPSRFNGTYSANKFLSHVAPGSIWDGASSFYGICPNSYVGHTNWIDIDGIPRSIVGEGALGDLWLGSSVGPTFDGRLGVDLSAPGDLLMTTYNPLSWWATFRFNLVNDGGGLYGRAGAVSAAAPIVTGMIALMLEMNPTLDAPSVKTLLHNARADLFTGPVPNTRWGYGKLDAMAVLDAACQVGPSPFCPAVGPNVVQNGDFSAAAAPAGWQEFATPDMTYIVSNVTGGVYQYYRVAPPPGTANQAVIFQNTGAAYAAGTALAASFDLGNSSTARKRISVLVIESDFSDIAVCTFWLPAGAPLRTYRMRTHTTKPWANASIYFYAASPNSDGGFYQIDNVSLRSVPSQSSYRTDCVDPTAPAPTPGAPSANLIVNGDFAGGLPPWGTFGTITWQIAGGVFEFIRTAGLPAGVVLQGTGQAMAANDVLVAFFQLGNSSGVRKRVTVLLHDGDFLDLAACTFWLPPGQPLLTYAMKAFATKTWTNATLSVYGATVGVDQWIRLDNASLYRVPMAANAGAECVEPITAIPPLVPWAGPAGSASAARPGADAPGAGRPPPSGIEGRSR